jgi:ABC-type dipeptide/oligopeptide/nickel transport system permease component
LPLGGFGAVNVILPASALALNGAAYYARLLHTNMRTVLDQDYVRSAHAKGLSPLRVYGKHALRNALIPLVTLLGLDFAGLMSGVVLTETVFNWPGLGRLAVDAVFNQDIPMIMGTVLFSAVLVVGANVLVDFLYVAIDPRIRYRQ